MSGLFRILEVPQAWRVLFLVLNYITYGSLLIGSTCLHFQEVSNFKVRDRHEFSTCYLFFLTFEKSCREQIHCIKTTINKLNNTLNENIIFSDKLNSMIIFRMTTVLKKADGVIFLNNESIIINC